MAARARTPDVVYEGRWNPRGEHKVTVNHQPLDPRLNLRNHSPTGFCWGYGGSGPAQLALAILCDYLGDDNLATYLEMHFKWEYVARLPQEKGWRLTGEDLEGILRQIDAKLTKWFKDHEPLPQPEPEPAKAAPKRRPAGRRAA